MNTANAGFYLDAQSLNGLKQRAQTDQSAALREVAGQFEALFVQMMLKSMRDASAGEDLFGSEQGDFYREMLDKQMATDMAASGSIGLADLLVRQLESAVPVSPSRSVSAMPAQKTNVAPVGSAPAPEVRSTGEDWVDPKTFVQALYPHARRAAARLNVDPAVLVAQSALETGWGSRVARQADGSNSYALFGIKADHRWDGERVAIDTLEYTGERFQPQRAAFRAYESIGQAMDDYADFISNSPRYQAALSNASDPEAYLHGLQQAGYATDPAYADKILSIYRGERLQQGLSAPQLAASSSTTASGG